MAEGARLESVYTATYRGFESPYRNEMRAWGTYAAIFEDENPDRGSTLFNLF